MSKYRIVIQLSLLLFFCMLLSTNAYAEVNNTTVTINVHDVIPNTEMPDEEMPVFTTSVSIYNLTKNYQEAKNKGMLDIKDFNEEWINKSLSKKGLLDLGEPLATEQTNTKGECLFKVPLLIDQHYGVYLITSKNCSITDQGMFLPTIILFPIVSSKTGELINPVSIYPKYIDDVHSKLSQFEQSDLVEKKPVASKTKTFPKTNEIKSILLVVGLLCLFMVINYYLKFTFNK
ncbi:pilin N-terminal domain-containing protein [Enterococcus sp. LJL99]